MRLLLVEDEPALAQTLARGLREEGYAVDTAASARRAHELTQENQYDLAILDLMLPDRPGLDLLQQWRHEHLPTPVLVLTARDTLHDKIAGLDEGADDYMTKPFAYQELLARVRSLLRRRDVPPLDVLTVDDLELDRTRFLVTRKGRRIDLTPKEFALLELFMLNPGRVLSRVTLAEHAWDASYEARTNVIDVMVARIRGKIGDRGGKRLLQTVKGIGYVLRLPEAT